MIKLYQFAPIWGLLNASQFCMKVEAYLKLAKIPYQTISISNPNKGPKGKLPFIDDNGKVIADSSLIIDYLKQTYGDPLDQHLTIEQQASALAIQRLLEEHFYWISVYNRWIDPACWPIIKSEYFSDFPPIIRNLLPELMRKTVKRNLRIHGLGRHSATEIYAFGQQDLTAVSNLLNNQAFMLGDKPSSIDACVYAFIANTLVPPIESLLKTHALTLTNLVDYHQRMKQLVETEKT